MKITPKNPYPQKTNELIGIIHSKKLERCNVS